MWNFEIGLTGLDAARKGLDVIGNNIANAATEGYHKQSINLIPAYSREEGGTLIGGGVDVAGVTRMMDKFLELEILNQQSTLGKVSQESTTLSSIESAFGELSGNTGLNASIDKFFSALSDLSAHPDQVVYQNEVLTAAEEMTGQFRTLGNYLSDLNSQIKLQAGNIVDQINSLSTQIAGLNDNIQRIEMSGASASNLVDQRDQLIKQLSEKVDVQTQQREYDVVDVNVAGIPIVMGTDTIKLEVGLNSEGSLGISPAGTFIYQTTINGGQLGGLLTLYNTTVNNVQSDLDKLANAITSQVNLYHCQGVGSDGSFTELSGTTMESEVLSDFEPPISDGSFYIRVTNTATGEVTRHQVNVDVSSDSLTSIAAELSSITGLNAFVSGSQLNIKADAGYKFDFLPAVLSQPTETNFAAEPPSSRPTVSVSGIYSGNENQTFTFKVIGGDPVDGGSVSNGTLKLEVRDGAGQLVDTLNIGDGYASGDLLDFGSGIKITISAGKVYNDDSFEVAAYANTDTSGFLAAAGINSFFTGSDASHMMVSDNVVNSPGKIATALGGDLTDNTNAVRLASIKDLDLSNLDSLTAGEFYRKLVSDIGQQLAVKQSAQSNSETLMQTLNNQQSDVSGVDINEEAAQMLVFEQMFQAMAKYLTTVNSTLSTLMTITSSS